MSNAAVTTWRQCLTEAIAGDGPLVACTLTEEELDRPFSNGYGCSEGAPFTAWTEHRVYFPVVYDGAEWSLWLRHRMIVTALEHGHEVSLGDHADKGDDQ